MTARQAINQECKHCCGDAKNWREVCNTPDCAIYFAREGGGSSVRKIKDFCYKCNPLQSYQGIKNCDGKYFDGSICVLRPFRFGKNPNRVKRVWTDAERDVARQGMVKIREKKASSSV